MTRAQPLGKWVCTAIAVQRTRQRNFQRIGDGYDLVITNEPFLGFHP